MNTIPPNYTEEFNETCGKMLCELNTLKAILGHELQQLKGGYSSVFAFYECNASENLRVIHFRAM